MWLGVQALCRARRATDQTAASAPTATASRRRSFRAGLLTNLLTPKVIVFYVTFLPQFVAPGLGVAARTALLATVFLALASTWLLAYTALLHRLRGVLSRRSVQRRTEFLTGVVLIGLGARLATDS